MRNQVDQASGCPLEFPGKQVLTLDSEGGPDGADVLAGVSVYVSVPDRNLGGGVRLNLFAEMCGTLQHVASVICPVNTVGLVMTVTGHVVDSWQVYAQATSPNQDIKVGMSGLSCCASPAVKVRPNLLPYGLGGEDAFTALQGPPMTPWGTGDEGAAGIASFSGAGATIDLPTGSRILHWEVVGNASGALISFLSDGRAVTANIDTGAAREGFPAGSLQADQITYAHLSYGSVDYVN